MRIDGAIDFETAADPIDEFFFAFFDGWLSGVMNARKPNAFFHEGIKLLEVIVLKSWMAAAAVGVNDDGIRAVKCFGIGRPAVAVNDRGYASDFVQTGF